MLLSNYLLQFIESSEKKKLDFIDRRRLSEPAYALGVRAGLLSYDNDLALSLATGLKKAMRFVIDDNLGQSSRTLATRTSIDTLKHAFNFMKMPYPNVWFETERNEGITIGFFLTQKNDQSPIEVIQTMRTDNTPVPLIGLGNQHIIGPEYIGIKNRPPEGSNPFDLSQDKEDYVLDSSAKCAACLLLLINSRSKMVKLCEENEPDKTAKKRFLRDKFNSTPLSTRRIKFDVSRILDKTEVAENTSQAEKIRTRQLVMGHFKVRKTGAFFWSPHIRYKDLPGDLNLDRKATLTEQKRTLAVAGLDFITHDPTP